GGWPAGGVKRGGRAPVPPWAPPAQGFSRPTGPVARRPAAGPLPGRPPEGLPGGAGNATSDVSPPFGPDAPRRSSDLLDVENDGRPLRSLVGDQMGTDRGLAPVAGRDDD